MQSPTDSLYTKNLDKLCGFIRSPREQVYFDFQHFRTFSGVAAQYFVPISVRAVCFFLQFSTSWKTNHLKCDAPCVKDNKSMIHVLFVSFPKAIRWRRVHVMRASADPFSGSSSRVSFWKSLGCHMIPNVQLHSVFYGLCFLFCELSLQHQLCIVRLNMMMMVIVWWMANLWLWDLAAWGWQSYHAWLLTFTSLLIGLWNFPVEMIADVTDI